MVVSQTYLVAQITVEQISLNLADEINSLKLKNFKFRGNRSIFVRTERLNTIVRKFARIAKSKLQNKFQSFSWKREWLNLYISKIENYLAASDATWARSKNTKTGS